MLPESDYIVYADESGDHSLDKINPDYPVFVLAFCIFQRTIYHPDKPNSPYDVIQGKFRKYKGKIEGAGLKVFP